MGTPNPDMMTQIASNPEMQTRIASGGPPVGLGGQGGQIAQAATPTPTAELTATSTKEPTATATPETYPAEQAAQAYFAALESGDFSAAAGLISSYSKMVSNLTSGDIVAELTSRQSNGWSWSDLEIIGSQVFDMKTVLVHVTYQSEIPDSAAGKTVKTSVDELWPFRLETGKWLYNWSNIIDYKTLGVDSQQAGGLTMKPMQLIRYTDKIRLVLLAQNGTSGATVIGRPNQVLATFHFGGKSVDAEQTRYFFDAYRSYPDMTIDAQGLYEEYPDSVEIVKFKDSATAPWFTFGLVD